MSDRDTLVAAIEEIGALLNDATLLAILKNADEVAGVLRYFETWAPQDCTFPYMTITAEARPVGAEDPYLALDIILDLWDAGTSSARLYAIRKRVLALLNRRIIECDEFAGRLRFTGETNLSEPEAEVWRRSTTWELRLYPEREVADMKAAQA